MERKVGWDMQPNSPQVGRAVKTDWGRQVNWEQLVNNSWEKADRAVRAEGIRETGEYVSGSKSGALGEMGVQC